MTLPPARRSRFPRAPLWTLIACAMLCGQEDIAAITGWIGLYGLSLAALFGWPLRSVPTSASIRTQFRGGEGARFAAITHAWVLAQGVSLTAIDATVAEHSTDEKVLPGRLPLAAYARHVRERYPEGALLPVGGSMLIGDTPIAVEPVSLLEALTKVPSWRQNRPLGHRPETVLLLAVCAMFDGVRSRYAMDRWVRRHGTALLGALGLLHARVSATGGIEFRRSTMPSHNTFVIAFQRLDSVRFENVLTSWVIAQGAPPLEQWVFSPDVLGNVHGEFLPGVRAAAAYARYVGKGIT